MIFGKDGIYGIDTSSNNEKLNQLKARDNGSKFFIHRSSLGQVEDKLFKEFDSQCVTLDLNEAIYHYEDYYSHKWLGYTSTQWGIIQGQKINSLNPRKLPVFIDIENALNQVDITKVRGTVITILDNILYQVDQWTGKSTGIYASLSKTKDFFYAYHKNRPLWVAWYANVTREKVLSTVSGYGWTNPVIWQYTSNEGGGIELGTKYANIDKNLWLKTETEFNEFFKGKVSNEPSDAEKLRILWDAYKSNK